MVDSGGLPAFVICGNVDCVAGSEHTTCHRCRAPIVVSPGTRRDAGPDAELLCMACGLPLMEGATLRVGATQLREVVDTARTRPSRN